MNDFTLRELEVFAAVMQHGTVTKAADFLDIAQPGVSKLLARLEARIGYSLFNRQRQRLIPTAEAIALYTEVERSFISAREIMRLARDLGDLRAGRLKIGILPALGGGLMPAIIHGFQADHPDVRITVNIRSTQTLVEWAGRNQLDLAIGVTTSIEHPAVVRRTLPAVPVVCVVPEGHALAAVEVVTLEHLERATLISLLASDPLVAQIERHAALANVRIPVAIETNLAATAIALCQAGAGVTVVDYLSAIATAAEGVIIKRFEPALSIHYSIYRQKGSKASALTDALIERVVEELSATIARFEAMTLRRSRADAPGPRPASRPAS
ncbi:LysR substrate-binding domain-containing protein [Burkholderia multivorans]|uniref:Transcriptional regulator n=1 Tax=Burkholderia multivorans TaxID=87883 RepID=A0AB37AUB0_9BURK|nr:LysR substrate-binding domain-containing protein [Burkholderia multivorans]PRE45407.1 transcriptional regulator [Burkholderia multivorans]PRE52093.1 transcriptional regulator [Burkholderia multivorans]